MSIKPVILCGGAGTRLWPLSTPETPKQFLALTSQETMISMTSSRLHGQSYAGVEIASTLVVGSARHESLLQSQLPGAELILEPFGRNSAPAVAAACIVSAPEDLLLILPADHHIERPEKFLEALAAGQTAAEAGAIVTFGIQPTHPSIDYGYIEFSPSGGKAKPVKQFVEKPPLETAEAYLGSGQFLWNAGIFLFKASTMLDAFKQHAPNILDTVRAALGTPIDAIWRLDPSSFSGADSISIDYAIMEHEDNIQVVPVDMGWSDVGDYGALWSMFSSTPEDNVTVGETVLEDCAGLYARSEGPMICASGLKDFVVVAKPDMVMISPRGEAKAVKTLGVQAQAARKTASGGTSLAASRALLMDAFDTWSDIAWDKENGGFVECLDMAGIPDTEAVRRVRVQARQVFSFARAISMGWSHPDIARKLMLQGLAYLNGPCRHPDGGWVHKVSKKGDILDDTRDLYDHAFILMAGAAIHDATGDPAGLKLAEEALSFIDESMYDEALGGYFDALPRPALRRANPHMHLLEAFIYLYNATKDKSYLDRAGQIVGLFEVYFFDPKQDHLIEHFNSDWSRAEGQKGQFFEPGHQYEWATLLAMYDKLADRDTLSWRRRLIKMADRKGLNKETEFACNCCHLDGSAIDNKQRIWHQLEMFRTRLWHPETGPEGDADRIFEALKASYFEGVPKGTWIDEIDSDNKPVSRTIPASILYHLVTAFDDSAFI